MLQSRRPPHSGAAACRSTLVLMPTVVAALALGSNLGDRAQNLSLAVLAIGAIAGCEVVAESRPFATEAVKTGPADPGGEFLNSAVLVETSLGPCDLLEALAGVEMGLGRVRDGRAGGGPRVMDIDIVLMGRLVMVAEAGKGPVIPHPSLHEREFVLAPVAEIAGGMVVPTLGRTVGELLGRLRTLEVGGRSLVSRAEVAAFEPNPPGRPKAANT